jgi:ketosteroid isomerase-like protein
MSRENVEAVRRTHEVWNSGDLDAWIDCLHPEITWVTAREDPDTASHEGREAVRRFVESWLESFGAIRLECEEYLDAGDKVIAWVKLIGAGRASTAPVELEQAQVMTIRDGRPFRVEEYFDRAEALEAAGLSE